MASRVCFSTTLRKNGKPQLPNRHAFCQSRGTSLSCKINTDVARTGRSFQARAREGARGRKTCLSAQGRPCTHCTSASAEAG